MTCACDNPAWRPVVLTPACPLCGAPWAQQDLYRKRPCVIAAVRTTEEMDIVTLEGTMHARKGDWIITGVRGERYPCAPDIFKVSYERVQRPLQPGVTPISQMPLISRQESDQLNRTILELNKDIAALKQDALDAEMEVQGLQRTIVALKQALVKQRVKGFKPIART